MNSHLIQSNDEGGFAFLSNRISESLTINPIGTMYQYTQSDECKADPS
jgi:hypothetical protein